MQIPDVIDFMREQGFTVDEPIIHSRKIENTRITEVPCAIGLITDSFGSVPTGYDLHINISYQDVTNRTDFGEYEGDWIWHFQGKTLYGETYFEKFTRDITKDDIVAFIKKVNSRST